jgi:hypothetical protein
MRSYQLSDSSSYLYLLRSSMTNRECVAFLVAWHAKLIAEPDRVTARRIDLLEVLRVGTVGRNGIKVLLDDWYQLPAE